MAETPAGAAQTHDVPIGELVRSVAMAIAEAQRALDDDALRVAERMSGQEVLRSADGSPRLDPLTQEPQVVDQRAFFGRHREGDRWVPTRLSMLELGFTPTFYQFAETTVELRLALRVTRRSEATGQTHYEVRGAPVDAAYQAHYGFDLEGSCVVKTKLVPVPAPPLLDQRIRLLLDEERRQSRAASRVDPEAAR